jgi:hypothetical protein
MWHLVFYAVLAHIGSLDFLIEMQPKPGTEIYMLQQLTFETKEECLETADRIIGDREGIKIKCEEERTTWRKSSTSYRPTGVGQTGTI